MAVTLNAKGTSYPSYTIGKRGVTLHQGGTEPVSANSGDFWFNTSTGKILSYNGANWTTLSASFTLITSASYTTASGERLAIDTTSGPITVTLPSSPSAGDLVEIIDNGDFSTNNLTVARNSSNIEGQAENLTVSDNNVHFWLQYKDGTTGWEVFGIIGGAGGGGSATTSTLSYTGGGAIAVGTVALLKDSQTYTLPAANAVEAGESILIELNSTYSAETPTVQRAGTDQIRYSAGTDTSYQFTGGAQSVRFVSNGTDEWEI